MEGDDFMGDRVPGKIKDSLPLIPDHVVSALEKGVDVPMEAFVSGPAREALEDRMRERNQPVHMENLVPVARNDPRIQPVRDGHTLPKVPQMRRVIPPPFQRPAAVMRQDHGRSWQQLRADQVAVDDIVIGLGKIVAVADELDYAVVRGLLGDSDAVNWASDVVVLSGMGGDHKAFSPSAPLRVFAKDGTGEVIKL